MRSLMLCITIYKSYGFAFTCDINIFGKNEFKFNAD